MIGTLDRSFPSLVWQHLGQEVCQMMVSTYALRQRFPAKTDLVSEHRRKGLHSNVTKKVYVYYSKYKLIQSHGVKYKIEISSLLINYQLGARKVIYICSLLISLLCSLWVTTKYTHHCRSFCWNTKTGQRHTGFEINCLWTTSKPNNFDIFRS